jgi:hypothetical protein
LFEVTDRITACFHNFADELIRKGNGASGIIDKTRLNANPSAHETGSVGRRQRDDLKLFSALGPELKHVLAPVDISRLLDDSIVLGAETRAKMLAASPANSKKNNHGDDGNDHHKSEN